MSGLYFFCSNLEKMWKISEKHWIWPDWGNTAWADMAGLGSIGLKSDTLETLVLIGRNRSSLNHDGINGTSQW